MKRPRDLEGAADTTVDDPVRRLPCEFHTIEHDRTRRREQRARQHVEDRALAGAVGADQAENLALLDLERHAVNSGEAAKALHQPVYNKHPRTSAYPVCISLVDTALAYWLLNVVPFGNGSTVSRCIWLFGHTT